MAIGLSKVFSLVIFDSATSSLKYESFMEDFFQIREHLTRFEEFLISLFWVCTAISI